MKQNTTKARYILTLQAASLAVLHYFLFWRNKNRPVELKVNLDKICTKLENGSFEAEYHPKQHIKSSEKIPFGNFFYGQKSKMAANITEKCHSSNIASLYAQKKLQKHCLFNMECIINYCKAKDNYKSKQNGGLIQFSQQKIQDGRRSNGQYDMHINNTIITTLQLSKHPHLDLNA